MASGGDAQERLIEIWTEWGLVPDQAATSAQFQALDVVETWLKRGETEPEIVIQAVQVLRTDPERPDGNKRGCLKGLRKALTDVWPNAGVAPERLYYSQALLLAAWSRETRAGWLNLAPLLNSMWRDLPGRERQRKELSRWRDLVMAPPPAVATQTAPPKATSIKQPPMKEVKLALQHTAAYKGTTAPEMKQHIADLKTYQNHQSHQWLPLTIAALEQCHATVVDISNNLQKLYSTLGKHGQGLEAFGNEIAQHNAEQIQALAAHQINFTQTEGERTQRRLSEIQAELNLFWWGQSRYCNAERKSYRLMHESGDVLWWASREAAELSTTVDVEPAAAYLVETLHSLGHDIFEKKPLGAWMDQLYHTIAQATSKVPAFSERFAKIAEEDALGLPVTWTRLRAARGETLTNAADAVAIDLSVEIDRGEWASWVFRETLLDLRLGKGT